MGGTACLAAIAAIAVLLAGCSDDDTSGEFVRTGPVPVETDDHGRLNAKPSPLTLADVARQPEGSPQRPVLELLFSAQWGYLPAVPDRYDPRIVSGLGRRQIVQAYGRLGKTLVETRPELRESRREGDDAFVSVELLTTEDGPTEESFVLARRRGDWKVVYDTLLARSLAANAASARYRALAASIGVDVRSP